MSWNKDYMKPIPLKGTHLGKLLRRVKDLENRGYEHVRPYQIHEKICADFDYKGNKSFGKGGYNFSGYDMKTEYSFLMRKKAE
ncbi:hypothetical protein [Bacillus sp. XF8]|uniref:hypothetical protein n=1 Tax=Bacillus sp. XF8 TaxID=2819289 RepID=UPI001AA01362|nr:hypothetical protein [Bacillus sp. XF8]MBO1583013.1 hypothetical protein [Bacillus sp. XF8]